MSSAAGYSSLPPYNRAKSSIHSLYAVRRPWRELLARPSSYSVPHGLGDFASRFRLNLAHFRVNYAMAVLVVLFLSLLYHPISIMVFLVAAASKNRAAKKCSSTKLT
ncbi:PRA1 family protein F2 [Striga hermonthica]|uniref:PRA1 family protein n=1 Tax=Striga hermonthica TaxID=68872 RepID=A0A9N7RIH9_STRHE|nr:PRA1 family protein F2 [Striga hermonthica]